MAGKIVGEQEKPFVKGSSKPNVEETLETKLRSMISSHLSQLVFKDGGKILDVADIQICVIRNPKNGKYKTHTTEEFNYEFSGDAQIGIKAPEGTQFNLKGSKAISNQMTTKRFRDCLMKSK